MKNVKQNLYYDKKTDTLWFNIKAGMEEESKEVAPGVNVELGKKGELLGIEILNASRVLGPKLKMSRSVQIVSIAHQINSKKAA